MAAQNKSELLDIAQKEFEKLTKLIDLIDANIAIKKRDEDISIKDIIAPRAHWIKLFLGGMQMALLERPFTFRQKVTNGTTSSAIILT